jgi:hypothetical protein
MNLAVPLPITKIEAATVCASAWTSGSWPSPCNLHNSRAFFLPMIGGLGILQPRLAVHCETTRKCYAQPAGAPEDLS